MTARPERAPRVPVSTYRMQVNATQDLPAVARRLDYLDDLGVDWVYLSPILPSEPGSDHGYDVVAHDDVDAARGGRAGLEAVAAEAHKRGMGVLVDIVPNHVGVATPIENAWWWDLLTHGPASAYARAFDVDWEFGGGKLRIPIVGDDDFDAVRVDAEAGEIRYHDHRFPLAPGTRELSEQHYELVHWKVADDSLNYRRFFAVNTLAAVRVEDPQVFADTHVEIERWFDEGLVDGLRVDHPDGLRDPAGYLRDLAELTGDAYVLVEKILETGEELPQSWATEGTTGYDLLALVDRVLVDPAGEAPLTALERDLRGADLDWETFVHDRKLEVARGILRSEVRRIVREVRAAGPETGSVTDEELEEAVAQLLAAFGVYRSYLPEGREHLEHAFVRARQRSGDDAAAALDLLEPLLGDPDHPAAARFQQTSGMVMAKGVEDCAFYRTSRLTSLSEVGGDPSVFACEPVDFHAAMGARLHAWPHAMSASSTHDTKRGEDVRARIHVLAELPDLWSRALERLLALAPLPDPNFGNLLWQAAVGAWPGDDADPAVWRARLHAYAQKAMREAGDRTTWTAPDADFEAAVHHAVDAAFDDPEVARVLREVVERTAGPGWSNALAAKLVTLTAPGVPDIYQGSELWEQSLVDPDNRRPVDLDRRADLLAAVRDGARPTLTASPSDPGVAKLAVVHAALRLRRERPELFGSYAPLAAEGEDAGHALAFDRGGAITVVTRLPVGLAARGGWGDTVLRLPAGTWRDAVSGRVFTGATPLADLLADLPVALLARTDQPIEPLVEENL